MQRWPNVPALFGWLGLDRRGRWLIKDEVISHPRIVNAINQNYAADEHGRWYFQNGPQRGYIRLESAPLMVRVDADRLVTHTGFEVRLPTAAFLDEAGGVLLATEHGPAEIAATDLDWILQRLQVDSRELQEDELVAALVEPSGIRTRMTLHLDGITLPVIRLDAADAPDYLHFVRDPQPEVGEKVATREMD
jgi:hypothetical protein